MEDNEVRYQLRIVELRKCYGEWNGVKYATIEVTKEMLDHMIMKDLVIESLVEKLNEVQDPEK